MDAGRFPAPDGVRAALARRPRKEIPDGSLVRAAVLLLLLRRAQDYDLLLTRRTEEVETHKGQVAFPGGMKDARDGTAIDTALREAEEEVGITRDRVSIAGLLDDLETPTGFVITPVVGILDEAPEIAPNAAEVASVFLVPLSFFAEGRHARREMRMFRGSEQEVFLYEHGGHLVWGVTAAIIRKLLSVLDGR